MDKRHERTSDRETKNIKGQATERQRDEGRERTGDGETKNIKEPETVRQRT